LNIPLIPMWLRILRIPYRILFPLILFFCFMGSYSVNNSGFDMACMLFFGLLGYVFRKFDYELAPLVLAFVLAPILERSFRQSLLMSHGSFLIFITRPISTSAIVAILLFFISSFFFKWRVPSTEGP